MFDNIQISVCLRFRGSVGHNLNMEAVKMIDIVYRKISIDYQLE